MAVTFPLDLLNPRWLSNSDKRYGLGIAFDCPHCVSSGAEEPHRIGVPFSQPLDGQAPLPAQELWDRQGEDFDALTIGDSIRVPGHGTVTVTKGEVEWDPYVTRQPEALPLAEFEAQYLSMPKAGRKGVALELRCPHCDDRVRLLFANPMDGKDPVGEGPHWTRQGGIDPIEKRMQLESLSIGTNVESPTGGEVFAPQEIVIAGHVTFTIEHGHVLIAGA